MGREQSLGYHTKDTGFLPATDQRVIDVRYAEEEEMFVAFCDDFQPFILASRPTEAEALLAARCAVLGVEVASLPNNAVGWHWRVDGDTHWCFGHQSTPIDALCAAIDAMEEK